MADYVSKYLGLKITMRNTRKANREFNILADPGKQIVFRDGKYRTSDEQEIRFLALIMKQFPEDVIRIDKAVAEVSEIKEAMKIINRRKDKKLPGTQGVSDPGSAKLQAEAKEEPVVIEKPPKKAKPFVGKVKKRRSRKKK